MRSVVILLLFALTAIAAPVPKALKRPPPAKPDGAWFLVDFDSDGRGGSAERMARDWVIAGEHIFVGRKTEPAHGDKGPPNFTLVDPTKPNLRKWGHNPAVYVVEDGGNTLRCCYAHDGRGTLTECKPQMGVHYYVFARVEQE